MLRRDLLKGAVVIPAALAAAADVPAHLWQGFDFGSGPPVHRAAEPGTF